MDAENEELKTDLELGLNYSNQCIGKNLKIDSGARAGANATSRVDMTFVAAGPLSELVWSTDKGLSLKCADSSFFNKNASHFWDVGPSNMVLAAPESVIGVRSTTDIPIDDVLRSVAAEYEKIDIAGTDMLTRSATKNSGAMPDCKEDEEHDTASSDNIEKMNAAEGVSNLHNDQMKNLMSSWGKNICNQANTGGFETPERMGNKFSTILDYPKPFLEQNPQLRGHTSEGRENGIENQEFEADDIFSSKVEPVIECKGSVVTGTNLTSFRKSPIEKLESTAENDLQTFNGEPAGVATSRVIVSKSNKLENNSQNNEMMLLCGKNLSVVHSPSNSEIHRNKGKDKALSDGGANVKLSNDEDDSHESVESCNSEELFLTGKKRRNFQQQLVVGSKRVKKQIVESSGSKSLIKQDSSFMNWISNMMKGFSKTMQIEENSLTLTLAHPGNVYQQPDQKHTIYNKNKDPGQNNTGFQSFFQSIYCPSLKNVGISTVNHVGESSKDFEPRSKVPGIYANPITYCAVDDVLYKQNMQSNDSVENESCSNLALDTEKEGMTSNSSSGRQNTNNTENIDSYELSERIEADKKCNGSDILGRLWITRFSPKSTSTLINSNHLNQSGGPQVHSTNCSMLPLSHKQIAYQNKSRMENPREQFADDNLLEANGLQSCSINKEASIVPKIDEGNTGHKSMYKLGHVLPSTTFQNSDPMPSKFARRLDAINIIPLNRTDNSTQANMFCSFCGNCGQQLHNFSEIEGNELEDLLKNINSYEGLEELPVLCIKCFQSNHWAVSCPTSISREQHVLEGNALVNECSPSGIQFNESKVDNARLITGEEDQLSSGGAINDEIDPKADRVLNLKGKANEITTSERIGCNASIKKRLGFILEENKLNENLMTSPSNFVERQNSDVPKRIFDVVKKLRLSRTDILKWMNSDMSISQLDGFFLRIRLGKWEEGLGGTGYYVASINEEQGQSTGKSLSVNVGGIKCMVESQYISNHEFLEEEIMAWWSTTSKADHNVPSEADLIEKIKKKKMLGF